jgi:Ca2+-binding RTX toxin-like protein
MSVVPAVAAAERLETSERSPAAVVVSGQANIYGAGRRAAPDPGGGGGGVVPPVVQVMEGTTWVTFPSVSGFTDCCEQTPATPPDGGSKYDTGVNGFEGISGVSGEGEMFLVGVFLGGGEPFGAPPAPMEHFDAEAKSKLWFTPELGQVFFIGDGRAGGRLQRFVPPKNASRLFLGFADALGFGGDPGYYDDNTGHLRVAIEPRVTCEGKTATYVGTSGDDEYFGTPDDDVIVGGSGSDYLSGGGGDDTICGNAGGDHLAGGGGHDVLVGGAGDDKLTGGAGDDHLKAGAGSDRLFGFGGMDVLEGGPGDDSAWGGRDGDRLWGGAGTDHLMGNEGNDTLRGEKGDDSLFGGPDDDRLFGGPDIDTGNGGGGTDTCRVEYHYGCEVVPGP